MPTILTLDAPVNFSFRQTLRSHGWSQLLPFEINLELWELNYVFVDENRRSVAAKMSEDDGQIKIETDAVKLSEKSKAKILRDARHVFRLDEDLKEFYKLTRKEKRLGWIARANAGRLLRSPTVFEDLVKTVCTTNCSWALTKKMTANLVEKLGVAAKNGKKSFPTAERMASVGADFYRDEIRAGYRSAYFAELAESVAGGAINPESWLASELPTKELKREMKQIKGVGDYAAENLLKLVGRYDGLALDSWLRAKFYEKHNGGQACADKDIERFYAAFEEWRGLAIWCDMSER